MPRWAALVVGIVWLVLVVNIWSNYGAWLGLLAALLLPIVLSLGFGLAGRSVLAIIRPGWSTFVDAWEKRIGDPRRSGFDVPPDEVAAMYAAYAEWRRERRSSGLSAGEWLDQRLGR